MTTKIIIESLAMDLRRVAQSYYRGSNLVGDRFSQEALKRVSEINLDEVKPYIKDLLSKVDRELRQSDRVYVAESSLMMSTLFQNYAQTFKSSSIK